RMGTGPGVEERRRRPEETVRACRVEAEILRKAEIIQRIPAVGSALSCGVAGMLGEEAAHGGLVAEHRGGVDVAAGNVRVRGEDRRGRVSEPCQRAASRNAAL